MQQIALSYQFLRRYPEEAAILDRALTIIPKDVATKVNRAVVDFTGRLTPSPCTTRSTQSSPGIPAQSPKSPIAGLFARWLNMIASLQAGSVALGDNPW